MIGWVIVGIAIFIGLSIVGQLMKMFAKFAAVGLILLVIFTIVGHYVDNYVDIDNYVDKDKMLEKANDTLDDIKESEVVENGKEKAKEITSEIVVKILDEAKERLTNDSGDENDG